MEFSQLEFFVTVVEEGSFSKAALRVYRISAPDLPQDRTGIRAPIVNRVHRDRVADNFSKLNANFNSCLITISYDNFTK